MVDKEFKILENKTGNLNLSEIFVLNNFKGKGLAKNVVLKVFDLHKANWQTRPVPMSNSVHLYLEKIFTKNFPYIVKKHEWKANRFAYTFSNL